MLNKKSIPSYETSDAIVAGIVKGDKNAEQAMIEKYGPALVYILERRIGDRDRARDIQQDAFIVVLQKLRKEPLSDPAKLSAYIHSTAINLFIGETRKEARRNTTFDSELLDGVAATGGDQYLNLVRDRAKEAVRKVIDELKNDRDRKILSFYYIEEWDKENICQELDLSHRHFDRVISRARARFRQMVEAQHHETSLGLTT